MESAGQVIVPLRSGGKKMRKRRELDALVAHSLGKRACGKRQVAGTGVNSQDQLLSQSTDDPEDYSWHSRIRVSPQCKSKPYSFVRVCGPMLFIVSTFLMFGFMYWLYFDLKEQLHDFRLKIEQVSASSQNVPEAIQKWHESSKYLEQNQSDLSGSIYDIKTRIEKIEKDFVQLKETINRKDENSESSKVGTLQNSLAELGAKLQEMSLEVNSLKNFSREEKSLRESDRAILTKLQESVLSTVNSSQPPTNYFNQTMDKLNEFHVNFTKELKNISSVLTNVNDTLTQKTTEIYTELRKHKATLDSLNENYANVTSHVISMENEWPQFKQTSISLVAEKTKLYAQLDDLRNASKAIANSVHDLEERFKQKQDKFVPTTNLKNEDSPSQGKPNDAIPPAIFETARPKPSDHVVSGDALPAAPLPASSPNAEQILPKSTEVKSTSATEITQGPIKIM